MIYDELYAFANTAFDPSRPVRLFSSPTGDHAVYWLGIQEESAFRCNTYLITDGDQAIVVDPGSRGWFPTVKAQVARLLPPERVSGLILCHQDPDVAASLPDWLELNPDLTVFSSPRTQVLLPYYGVSGYRFHDVEAEPLRPLPSGAALRFVPAPFLHSPMAFATLDEGSHLLFTGDIFAAIDTDWQLVVENFDQHRIKLDYFHIDYMAANAAAVGFVNRLEGIELAGLLPQHGSIIPRRFVADALDYLRDLQCGLDLLYPELMP